ncbi:hypothetical protein AA313_de0203465 [Arthrobotrys entomopaga]|nr:hypothetical protein AA313_de0203465 [Arthrobotrys entomopaga]
MPSKSTTRVALTPNPKSLNPSKSKAPKSSEYIDDSDDSDEQMTDAPSKKTTTPKSTEKTSKKRNRDGTEKVNGSGKNASNREAASSSKKKGKKVVEVVEESSEESSGSEEESSEEEGEESESEASQPTKSSKSKNTPTFTLPLDRDVPAGYTPLDSTSSDSIPSSLQGKQILLFTAPSNFSFSDVKKIKLHSGLEGETIETGESKFTIRRSADSVSSSMRLAVPREGKKGYQLASIAPTIKYVITEAPPSTRSKKATEKAPPPLPRAQPEGLRMRFMPAGYGEESDLNINGAVLPRKDLIQEGGEDVAMEDISAAAPTPKKAKKSEAEAVESPKEKKKKKKSKPVEEDIPADTDGDLAQEPKVEKTKSKKEKKDKSTDEGGKKEKKKHKKDKSSA